ncbi:alpha/beta fold hydrolase [Streptomyces vilmorinianum]|uniref:alpha/beta fold hydrolase n=1 Tax=Streptomyces vilmorinianum TaxID=3051092 RepID=UPI0010FB3BE6|nr:alpha/beta hydrolase [Streptomyces vilmorinianum]
MPQLSANGVDLFYEVTGEGEPLILVHGSWNDHRSWQPAVDADIKASFQAIRYDRRGHGQSTDAPGQGTRRQDEDDLAALIEQLGGGSAYVAANSFGAAITLGLAARRPELFRGVVVHEPPLVGVVADDHDTLAELQPMLTSTDAVIDHLRKGENEPGARLFVEEIALGPGMWDQLPEQIRETFVTHAQTWLEEEDDPGGAELDLDALSACTAPVLLCGGTTSPAWFSTILERLTEALPQVRRHTFEGAGHIPHVTHPQEYADTVTRFLQGRL